MLKFEEMCNEDWWRTGHFHAPLEALGARQQWSPFVQCKLGARLGEGLGLLQL